MDKDFWDIAFEDKSVEFDEKYLTEQAKETKHLLEKAIADQDLEWFACHLENLEIIVKGDVFLGRTPERYYHNVWKRWGFR